ncbi:MAG: hypothetical protein CMH69_09425 [Nitratireductor sp.]|nr:hypothetical protein [Nitratireductor sp.]
MITSLLFSQLVSAFAQSGGFYTMTESYSTVTAIEEGSPTDGWPDGKPNVVADPDDPGSVILHSGWSGEAMFGRGWIRLGETTFVQRDLTLPEVNLLFPYFYVAGDGYDPDIFPLDKRFIGPRALTLLSRRPDFPSARLFFEAEPRFGELRALLPIDDHLIQISFQTVWIEEDLVGEALATVAVFEPDEPGLVFSEAEADPSLLGDDLEFTEEEALEALAGGPRSDARADSQDEEGLNFTEDDVRRFIDQENDDYLKILGCAAGWRACPYDLDPEAVRIWMQIEEDPAELLAEIVNERRAAEGR